MHRTSRLVSERTAVINQIRGFLLERGIIVRQGLRFLRQALPDILAKRTDVLSPLMVRIVADLASDWRQLDERIEPVTDEIETLAKSDDSCRRVMTVPGIGPIISSAMVAAIGNGAAFARGRDFSAWIGLVPKQMSTGDRTILGRITKRGNGYLRTLFVQAARVILLRKKKLYIVTLDIYREIYLYRWAMCGRLRVGKGNLHVAELVSAAMCSAFECGSHDRWP